MRSRILAIALIPSLVLVTAVTGVMSHLVEEAGRDRRWADTILRSAPHAVAFYDAIVQERRLTLLRIAQRPYDRTALPDERRRVDTAVRELGYVPTALSAIIPGTFDKFGASVDEAVRQLLDLRGRVDADLSSVAETYETFGRLIGVQAQSLDIMAQHAPDAESAVALTNVARLFRAADAMSAAHALAAAVATDDGLDDPYLQQFVGRVGAYHAEVDMLAKTEDEELRARIAQLTGSPAWQSSAAMEAALINRGSSRQKYAAASNEVAIEDNAEQSVEELRVLWRTYYQQVQERVVGTADETTRTAFVFGGLILGATVVAFLATLWLANRMTRRLMRLRRETLGLVDDRIPSIIARIHAGEDVDVDSALPELEFGDDEIGQVAHAFETAQRTAVAAVVTEAKTRDAVNAVFLNLAHRSQLMAHRQLEVLDAAESREENPALLSLLFKLDHLATRERRNAENLIILGGERPGRQWRNPVPLRDVVRSAIAETEDYARVRAARLPDVRIKSGVVADIIHLLAELIENALSFSPPASQVEISGNPVGKGAVVEIVDQGLGMPADELARVNTVLAESPDFGVLQLSSDSRLGLIVVSVLASRNDIKVRLTESDYGGVKAVVVIPSALLADDATAKPHSTPRPEIPASTATLGEQEPQLPITTGGPPAPNLSPPDSGAVPERSSGARPSLPRRHRHASLAPQLSERPIERLARPVATPQSAEQARDLIANIAHGTEQGRRAPIRPPRDDEERRP